MPPKRGLKGGSMTDTQNAMLLKHLKTHKRGITPMVALERYGIYRLSGRIHDLRSMGYEIETHQEQKKNRYGHVVRFARYTLEG